MNPDRAMWLPMQRYLDNLFTELRGLDEGEVASYIPELALADPEWFGIALVTVDGSVYLTGDARREFTVQSISKAITYGIALEDNGIDGVFAKVGVEPSGEAFNSISLEPDTGRPMNPMINAGAIATTGLIKADTRGERLARILERFEKYVGHRITVDEQVYKSERDTGHRNRAISHLLRNADILTGDPEDALDVYFKQCSIKVTARDLALMGACLANNGVSPITGVVALGRRYVDKVLSVMSTCGMYDYSGNWVFSVGMPAKSGVGGGIMAVLPGQFGLGVFSPRLDSKGNSFRGIRVCEAISRDFSLHTFKVAKATSASVLRVRYDASVVSSKRLRGPEERNLLAEHGSGIQVYELQGELMFGSSESVIRTIADELESASHVIIDFRRVVELDSASMTLFAALCSGMTGEGKRVFLTGTDHIYRFRRYLSKQAEGIDSEALLHYSDLDRAMEGCEGEIIGLRTVGSGQSKTVPLEAQYLCQGLSAGEIERLCTACRARSFAAGETIFNAGEPADTFFFVLSGLVDILVESETKREHRLVTMSPGMSFGEFAMLTEAPRSAKARAVLDTTCSEIRFADIDDGIKVKLLGNLAGELSRRLAKEAGELRVLG